MKRIGILGGSFDPVHRGHVAIARAALKELRLDSVTFVPAKISPLKRNRKLAAPRHRLAMLRLALGKNPRFKISPYELKSPGPSYTIRTLKHFHRKYPAAALFLLMGSDSFSSFEKWREWKKISALCTVTVARRKGGRSISERLIKTVSAHILKSSIPGISSTDVRRRGVDAAQVPPAVLRYLGTRKIY